MTDIYVVYEKLNGVAYAVSTNEKTAKAYFAKLEEYGNNLDNFCILVECNDIEEYPEAKNLDV